jgi:phytoene dehydrogenase-like protein
MEQNHDVIIIGSGPNALAIGAYLSRAGEKVLLLEKRFEAGGGLATEQVTLPDYYHNTHAVYMMMADYAPVYADFEFEARYGVRHIRPELQVAMPLSDGRCLCMYSDLERSCASIARFSKKDADSYREMYHRFDEMMKHILGPQTYVPMEAAPMMAAKAEQTELGRELAAFAEQTPEEIVCERFEDEHVRTLMLYMACHWGLEYDQSGVSYMVPIYLNRMVKRPAQVDLREPGADQDQHPDRADHRRERRGQRSGAGRWHANHGWQGRGEHHRHRSNLPEVRR